MGSNEKEHGKEFKGNSVIIVVLTILLLISLYANITFRAELNEINSSVLIGSYVLSNPNSNSDEFFVFNETYYYRYIQFEMLDQGTFIEVSKNIYNLKSHDANEYMVVYSNKTLYYYDISQSVVWAYSKFSDVPTFINVDEPRIS